MNTKIARANPTPTISSRIKTPTDITTYSATKQRIFKDTCTSNLPPRLQRKDITIVRFNKSTQIYQFRTKMKTVADEQEGEEKE